MLKFSVLIATYRRPDYLTECLEALSRQQRLPDQVVIVVRDTDQETQTMLQRYDDSTLRPLIQVAEVREVGIVAAENAGLEAVTGDVVALIDDDAIAMPDWLHRIAQHYQDPSVGAVGGPTIPYINRQPQIQHQTGPCLKKTWYGAHRGHTERIPDGLKRVSSLRGCNMSFRRSLVERIDPALLPYWRRFEDDITLSIGRKGYQVLLDPYIQVYHHTAPVKEGQSRESDPTSIYGSHHNNTYVMLKHAPAWQRPIFLAFTFLVGDAFQPGVARYLAKGMVRRQPGQCVRELRWALQGKVAGVRLYLKKSQSS